MQQLHSQSNTIKEVTKGNVVIRLNRCEGDNGFALNLFAFNPFAGDFKLIHAVSGIEEEAAFGYFDEAMSIIEGYSWEANDYVYRDDK